LTWLKANTATRVAKLVTIARAFGAPATQDREAMQRMALHQPAGAGEKLYARLVAYALAETAAAE
jgi:hypothetical protein